MKGEDKLSTEERRDLRRVFCDGCGEDISGTSWSYEDYLVLTTQAKRPWYVVEGQRSGGMYPESRSSRLDRDYHFCDRACLTKWLQSIETVAPHRGRSDA